MNTEGTTGTMHAKWSDFHKQLVQPSERISRFALIMQRHLIIDCSTDDYPRHYSISFTFGISRFVDKWRSIDRFCIMIRFFYVLLLGKIRIFTCTRYDVSRYSSASSSECCKWMICFVSTFLGIQWNHPYHLYASDGFILYTNLLLNIHLQ